MRALDELARQEREAAQKYLNERAAEREKQEIFARMNRAFLDEQAGVLAATLRMGNPARCAARDRIPILPRFRCAPTEAELETASAAADEARTRATRASEAAGRLKGQREALQNALRSARRRFCPAAIFPARRKRWQRAWRKCARSFRRPNGRKRWRASGKSAAGR